VFESGLLLFFYLFYKSVIGKVCLHRKSPRELGTHFSVGHHLNEDFLIGWNVLPLFSCRRTEAGCHTFTESDMYL
jgi:hypothetical protein